MHGIIFLLFVLIKYEKVHINNNNKLLNPYFEQIFCKYCNYIITIQIITKECEHGFCFECIKNDFINKPISSTVCAACGINVTPEKISHSRLLSDLIKTFKEPCSKGCGAEVELQYMDYHKIKCTGASPSTMNHVTLTNILELSPEDNKN